MALGPWSGPPDGDGDSLPPTVQIHLPVWAEGLWSHGTLAPAAAGLPHVSTLPGADSCQRPAARPLPRRNLHRDTFHRNGQRNPQHVTCPTSTPVAFGNEKTISNQNTQHRAPVCFRGAAWRSGQGRYDFRPARRLAVHLTSLKSRLLNLFFFFFSYKKS